MKKMYIVQSDNGEFWCGMNIWDKQLRKAKIFHSLKYAGECCERFKARNPKIVEVSLTIVPEMKTNADRIRAMSNEGLCELARKQIGCGFDFFPCGVVCDGKCESFSDEDCQAKIMKWLQQEAE